MIAVFAKLTAKPGCRDQLLEAVAPLVACALEQEPGTEVYALHKGAGDAGDVVWLYEVFTDEDSLRAHADNEARMADVKARVDGLLAGPMELVWGRPLERKGFA